MRRTALFTSAALAAALVVYSPSAKAEIEAAISVNFGPPPIPVYEQPPCPAPDYMWTPGYWAYGPDGYYWVPGTWVAAPAPGLLWTPGYWALGAGGLYLWHAGYWGPHVGFYGGINYGFGYGGSGFVGGEWRHGSFAYNTAVVHVNETVVRNVYVNKTVINEEHGGGNRASFNGGPGGIAAQPTAQERSFANEQHQAATQSQTTHEHAAALDRANLASANHGTPAHTAMERPAASPAPEPAHAAAPPKQAEAAAQPQPQHQAQQQHAASPAPAPGHAAQANPAPAAPPPNHVVGQAPMHQMQQAAPLRQPAAQPPPAATHSQPPQMQPQNHPAPQPQQNHPAPAQHPDQKNGHEPGH